MIDHKAKGKKSRLAGKAFEVAVGKHLTDAGWIVTKWNNQIDLEEDCIKPAKNYYIPGRGNAMGSGFPDFIAFKKPDIFEKYILYFIECKINNKLDKKEKMKLDWLIKKGHKCLVAYQDEEKEIRLREFLEYEERASTSGKETKRDS